MDFVDLWDADLSEAKMAGVAAQSVDLQRANLTKADLTGGRSDLRESHRCHPHPSGPEKRHPEGYESDPGAASRVGLVQ
ncbi:pentapeptide repeat-containing protein [Rhodococcus erythropolis]|uniref:pentapeptide repeat-containing protein n=1 Tax=Rhodococcus erythropolis TaxID=1833 RepID=UPI00398230D3